MTVRSLKRSSLKVSIIIPAKPGETISCIGALENLKNAQTSFEVIVPRGYSPSRQRNLAAKEAQGEYLYFIDDDSFLSAEALSRGVRYLDSHPHISAIGGPALTRNNAESLEAIIGRVLASPISGSYTRARHCAVGGLRSTRGEELSFANFLIRKADFIAVFGLKETLYPSEDPEFFKRITKLDLKISYDPDLQVERGRRKTFAALSKQFYRYGKGRAEHYFSNFRLLDLFFLLPSLFLSILILLALINLKAFIFVITSYALIVLIIGNFSEGSLMGAIKFLFALSLIHLSYSLGFIREFLPGSRKTYDYDVVIERLESVNEGCLGAFSAKCS